MVVYCENYEDQVNTLCGKHAELLVLNLAVNILSIAF
jgi:hypothetical protein